MATAVPEEHQFQIIKMEEVDLELNREKRIGSGSFANVYYGKYKKLGVTAAFKVLKGVGKGGLEEEDEKLLIEEAKSMYKLSFNNVVTMYGIINEPNQGLFALVMEYMEYGSLADLMKKIELGWPLKLRMLLDVVAALNWLHTPHPPSRNYRVPHRDIKAANILVNQGFIAKLSDFGLAKLKKISSSSTGRHNMGTPTHTPPEVLKGTKEHSESTDVWSFGVTIFEVGKGTPLWFLVHDADALAMSHSVATEGRCPISTEQIQSECPTQLKNIMMQCVQYNPQNRPSFKDISQVISQCFDQLERNAYNDAMIAAITALRGTYENVPRGEISLLSTSERLESVHSGGQRTSSMTVDGYVPPEDVRIMRDIVQEYNNSAVDMTLQHVEPPGGGTPETPSGHYFSGQTPPFSTRTQSSLELLTPSHFTVSSLGGKPSEDSNSSPGITGKRESGAEETQIPSPSGVSVSGSHQPVLHPQIIYTRPDEINLHATMRQISAVFDVIDSPVIPLDEVSRLTMELRQVFRDLNENGAIDKDIEDRKRQSSGSYTQKLDEIQKALKTMSVVPPAVNVHVHVHQGNGEVVTSTMPTQSKEPIPGADDAGFATEQYQGAAPALSSNVHQVAPSEKTQKAPGQSTHPQRLEQHPRQQANIQATSKGLRKGRMVTNWNTFETDLIVDELLAHLISGQVLSPQQADDVKSSSTHQGKNFNLLQILYKKDEQALMIFQEALRNTHQSYLADYLERSEEEQEEKEEASSVRTSSSESDAQPESDPDDLHKTWSTVYTRRPPSAVPPVAQSEAPPRTCNSDIQEAVLPAPDPAPLEQVPPREVTMTDISTTSKYVGKAWKLLGRELGFLDGELETLRIDYYAEGQRETTYQMLRKWKNKNGSAATLEVLVKALHIVNRDDVIQILLAL